MRSGVRRGRLGRVHPDCESSRNTAWKGLGRARRGALLLRGAGIRGVRCWFGSRKEEFSIVGVSWKVGSGGVRLDWLLVAGFCPGVLVVKAGAALPHSKGDRWRGFSTRWLGCL